uniref:Uncharacterized protein n=1 Tax=Arundo donax TaxID=35708 RepID=A0A0A9HFP2_ARUDO
MYSPHIFRLFACTHQEVRI